MDVDETIEYAVIVTGKPVRSSIGSMMSNKGDEFIVTESEWGETSQRHRDDGSIPARVRTFDSEGSANEFALGWNGHPWWVDPEHFRVIRVVRAYKVVRDGWNQV